MIKKRLGEIMLDTIRFYSKMVSKYIKRETVNKNDYQNEYDHISKTYDRWINVMGQYTQEIIKPELIEHHGPIKLLDLACGTGYISNALLKINESYDITAVDLSEGMLNQFDQSLKKQVTLVNQDVIEFLKDDQSMYQGIYCGWALPYFDHRVLIPLINQRLAASGIVSIISNAKGTLSDMESIFLTVMKKHQEQLKKPMNISQQLPQGKNALEKWFKEFGFKGIFLEEKEVSFTFDNPKDLLKWLMETGALAGTRSMFYDYQMIETDLIKEIEKRKYKDGRYVINHRFVYGIFRK